MTLQRILPLSLFAVSVTAILGSLAYTIYGLPRWAIYVVAIATALLTFYARRFLPPGSDKRSSRPTRLYDKKMWGIILAYIVVAAVGFIVLFAAGSDAPLVSPWQMVSPWLFVIYGAASFVLLFAALRRPLPLFLLIIHYAWSFSVLLIIYAVGYGFDPFIHQAAVTAIKQAGRIEPFTPYYLGQYSLVLIGQRLLGGSLAFWDKLLVPLLAALTVPPVLYRSLRGYLSENSRGLAALGLLIFPAGLFIVTTPQHLGYLFLLLAVLWSLRLENRFDFILLWLLALAAATAQPIAGIPALLIAAMATLPRLTASLKKQRAAYAGLIALGAGLLPLIFYIVAKANPETAAEVGRPQWSLFTWLIPSNPVTEPWLLNSLYFFGNNIWLIFVLMSGAGAYIAYRKKYADLLRISVGPALALTAGAVIASAIDFRFLIDYERSDYPERLLAVAGILLIPCLAIAWGTFADRLAAARRPIRFIWLIGLSALLTASLYFAYPRQDHYYNSRAFAVTPADIAAVTLIGTRNPGEDYVVLANQQVSAAALRVGGFKKYYDPDIFYYAIPTGGPLYALYLEMAAAPSRDVAERAMDLAGVDRAYFVLNDYWWAFDKIKDEAALEADAAIPVAGNQLYIFEFLRK